jgi:hypothetical protein
MKPSNRIDATELEERIIAFLMEVKERFPPARVSLTDEMPRRLRFFAEIPGAASIEILPDPGQIDVSVGREGRLELLNLSSVDAALELVRPVVEAVAEGRFEETIWTLWGRTVRAESRLRTPEGDEQVVSKTWRPLGLIIPGRKVEISYAPYVRPGAG